MNGGIKETFRAIKARADYTVLISDSKHVYLSCKKTDQPFNQLFGKPYNSKHCHMGVLKKLPMSIYQTATCWLSTSAEVSTCTRLWMRAQ